MLCSLLYYTHKQAKVKTWGFTTPPATRSQPDCRENKKQITDGKSKVRKSGPLCIFINTSSLQLVLTLKVSQVSSRDSQDMEMSNAIPYIQGVPNCIRLRISSFEGAGRNLSEVRGYNKDTSLLASRLWAI